MGPRRPGLPWRGKRPARGGKRWQKPKFDHRARFLFTLMDLRREEEDVDKLHEEVRWVYGGPPIKKLDPPRVLEKIAASEEARERPVYPVFRDDFQQAIRLLQALQAPEPGKAPDAPPKKEEPFYQIYAELHGIESRAMVPQSDFAVPEGFAEETGAPESEGIRPRRKSSQ